MSKIRAMRLYMRSMPGIAEAQRVVPGSPSLSARYFSR